MICPMLEECEGTSAIVVLVLAVRVIDVAEAAISEIKLAHRIVVDRVAFLISKCVFITFGWEKSFIIEIVALPSVRDIRRYLQLVGNFFFFITLAARSHLAFRRQQSPPSNMHSRLFNSGKEDFYTW